ncbi:hypothetical protein M758_6G209500 [Ceratodon purpureus]|uniref:Myb-like domain-containing protein n=1 Tax=Ceratodon purpureus TaxID=3225 RepID=A0A8T0HK78_CERPU|nr:hypothetical protein KC19_6G219100 [Ceratodon purpureus]KAG0614861.1 hypothetical protein M758_6G209500 [Ceratodon purpureus]
MCAHSLTFVIENRTLFGVPISPTPHLQDGSMMFASASLRRPIFRGSSPSVLPRGGPPIIPAAARPSLAKRTRKDRGPNWSPQENAALITAKQEMFLQGLDIVDGRDHFTPETRKWICVSHVENMVGVSLIVPDGPACKTKWNQLVPYYKRIADYLCKTGRNALDYWDMNPSEKKLEGLPRVFAQDVYEAIHEWFANMPMIQPPHTHDMLSPSDGNLDRLNLKCRTTVTVIVNQIRRTSRTLPLLILHKAPGTLYRRNHLGRGL